MFSLLCLGKTVSKIYQNKIKKLQNKKYVSDSHWLWGTLCTHYLNTLCKHCIARLWWDGIHPIWNNLNWIFIRRFNYWINMTVRMQVGERRRNRWMHAAVLWNWVGSYCETVEVLELIDGLLSLGVTSGASWLLSLWGERL